MNSEDSRPRNICHQSQSYQLCHSNSKNLATTCHDATVMKTCVRDTFTIMSQLFRFKVESIPISSDLKTHHIAHDRKGICSLWTCAEVLSYILVCLIFLPKHFRWDRSTKGSENDFHSHWFFQKRILDHSTRPLKDFPLCMALVDEFPTIFVPNQSYRRFKISFGNQSVMEFFLWIIITDSS